MVASCGVVRLAANGIAVSIDALLDVVAARRRTANPHVAANAASVTGKESGTCRSLSAMSAIGAAQKAASA